MPQHTTVVKMRQNKGVVKLCLGINWQNIPQPSYLRESIKTLPSHISNVVPPSQTVINPHPQALQLHHRLSLQLAYITDSESLWSSASVQDSVQSVHNPVHESSPRVQSRIQSPKTRVHACRNIMAVFVIASARLLPKVTDPRKGGEC